MFLLMQGAGNLVLALALVAPLGLVAPGRLIAPLGERSIVTIHSRAVHCWSTAFALTLCPAVLWLIFVARTIAESTATDRKAFAERFATSVLAIVGLTFLWFPAVVRVLTLTNKGVLATFVATLPLPLLGFPLDSESAVVNLTLETFTSQA